MIKNNSVLQYTIDFNIHPAASMALDDEIIGLAIQEQQSILRLMSYNPETIILGQTQPKSVLKTSLVKQDNLSVVKRYTGGTAVLVTGKDLAFTLILHKNCFEKPIKKYLGLLCYMNSMIAKALYNLGLSVAQSDYVPHTDRKDASCFSLADRCELKVKDTKIYGAAYKFNGDVFIQQGFVPIVPYNKIFQYLKTTVGGRGKCVNDFLHSSIDNYRVIDNILLQLRSVFSCVPFVPPVNLVQNAYSNMDNFKVL